MTSSQISRILKGETKTINSDMLMALAQEFGVSTDYILGIVNNPENTQSVENTENLPAESKDMEERREQPFHTPMLLMSSSFPLGGCIDFIESLADQDEKMMAYAEYYYFSGHHEKAVEYAEMYLDHPDIMLKMSACLIYTFANLSLNHIHSARMGLNRLTENLNQVMKGNTDRKAKAFGVFVAVAAHTLLHLPVGDIPPLSDYVGEFKKGKQLWGVYVLAHKAYLDREYQRSLGIVEACLMTTKEIYPISMIYLNLVAAMNAMNLMQTELAKKYFSLIGLEIYPVEIDEYKYLHEKGADFVTVFQETYNTETYKKVHLAGQKSIFPYRINAQERAILGGMRGVGFGALLGLDDFRHDAFCVGVHATLIQRKYPHAEIAVSVPRLRPYINGEETNPRDVHEKELLQIMCAYRLLMPFASITISTRERSDFRNNAVNICATKISAGVSVGIGGHSEKEKGDEQFEISDPRSVDEVVDALHQYGLQPSFNDYIRLI